VGKSGQAFAFQNPIVGVIDVSPLQTIAPGGGSYNFRLADHPP